MFVLGLDSVASADLIPPSKKPQPPVAKTAPGEVEMIVRIDPQAKEAKLIVPAGQKKKPAAAPEANAASGTRTMAAGMALSAGLASLVLLRRRKAVAVVGSAAAGLFLLVLGAAVEANVPPPHVVPKPEPPADWLTAARLIAELGDRDGRSVSGRIKLEYSESANVATLVLPRSLKNSRPEANPPKAAPPATKSPPDSKPSATPE